MTGHGAAVAAVGLVTPWGTGLAALPDDVVRAAAGRDVVPVPTPPVDGERFRRATRECVLGVAAVGAALDEAGLDRDAVRGSDTALVYVTAAAYAAANRTFIEGAVAGAVGATAALHFPYTAPSAVAAQVAIEFGLTGSYVILIGGATATLDALWHAAGLVGRGDARRALVLAVETFTDCADLWARGRRLVARPLVEAAACALLVPADTAPAWRDTMTAAPLEEAARRRAGQTLACAPLVALALGGASGDTVTAAWRGRRAALEWSGATRV